MVSLLAVKNGYIFFLEFYAPTARPDGGGVIKFRSVPVQFSIIPVQSSQRFDNSIACQRRFFSSSPLFAQMRTGPEDDPRPQKKRKNAKAESVPIWERTRTFGAEKRNKASLPVIQDDGIVKRLNVQRPKFRARAQNSQVKGSAAVLIEEKSEKGEDQPKLVHGRGAPGHGHLSRGPRKHTRRKLEDFAENIERVEDAKARIADIALKVVANPEENVALLNELRLMAMQCKGKVAALVILTESQLFKDIIPTYKIRQITEKEAETKVSRDVARLRNYEEKLLKSYQIFVKSCISKTKWGTGGGLETEASRNMSRVRFAACKALSELICSLPHFNEADHIAGAVCNLVADREPIVRSQCAEALTSVLGDAHRASGQTLNICVLIAKSLANVADRKGRAAPVEVVQPLTKIQFSRFARLPSSSKAKNAPKKSKRFIKKRRRKPEKSGNEQEETELERDLREGDAEATSQELYRAKKHLLDYVCHTYFNIIKEAGSGIEQEKKSMDKPRSAVRRKKPPLVLPVALKGLLRVASFINTDIIEAILGALTPLLQHGILPLTMRFQCLSASYAILAVHSRTQQTDPDSFTGDARAMDTCLYAALGCLYGPDMQVREDENITFDAIEAVLSSMSFRDFPLVRSTAMARRLAIFAASLAPTHACTIGLLRTSQDLLPSALVSPIYPQKLDNGDESEWGDEADLIQAYDMETDDPEIANSERSASWELSSLVCHFHPTVRAVAAKMASGYCGARLPKASENILLMAKGHDSGEGGFNPAPQSQIATQNKRGKRKVFDAKKDQVLCKLFRSEEERMAFEEGDSEIVDYFEKHWREMEA